MPARTHNARRWLPFPVVLLLLVLAGDAGLVFRAGGTFGFQSPGRGYINTIHGGISGEPSDQATFAENLRNDQKSLDRGVFAHTRISGLGPGTQTILTVTITDVGKPPFRANPLPIGFPGWVLDHQNVPTGGIVSVTASCDSVHLKCQPESPARQAVLTKSRSGNWAWAVTALRPGTGHITLTATTYDRDTQTVLNEAAPVTMVIRVHGTAAYQAEAIVKTASGLLRWIGPALLFAAAAAIWTKYRKRRNIIPNNAPSHSTADPPRHSVDAAALQPENVATQQTVQPLAPRAPADRPKGRA